MFTPQRAYLLIAYAYNTVILRSLNVKASNEIICPLTADLSLNTPVSISALCLRCYAQYNFDRHTTTKYLSELVQLQHH